MQIMKKIFNTLLLLMACQFSTQLIAQTRDNLNKEEIEISGEYNPIVKEAERIASNPQTESIEVPKAEMNYNFLNKTVESTFQTDSIPPASIKKEPLTKLYPFYIKAGFGTNVSPLAEVYINSVRNKSYNIGLSNQFFSTSSKVLDQTESNYLHNRLNLYGTYFLKKYDLGAKFNYNIQQNNYYGFTDLIQYELIKPNIQNPSNQQYSTLEGSVYFKKMYVDSNEINISADANYYNFKNRFGNSENHVDLNVKGFKYFTKLKVGADYVLSYNQSNPNALIAIVPIERKLLEESAVNSLKPYIKYDDGRFKGMIGANISIASVIGSVSDVYFYPNLHAEFQIVEKVIVPFAGISGGIKQNTFRGMAERNPFVGSQYSTPFVNNKFDFYGGIKGNATSKIAFNATYSYSQIDNFMMFSANSLYVPGENKIYQNISFTPTFEYADVSSIYGEISYQKDEKLRILAKGKFNKYKPEFRAKAFYLPEFEAGLTANYNLKNKIIAKADLFYIGSRFSDVKDLTNNEFIKLNGTVDVNLGVEYRYNNKISFFLDLNNVGFVQFQRYYQYPTQRFNLIAGLTFSF